MQGFEKINAATEKAADKVISVFVESELTNEEAAMALDKMFDTLKIGISKSRNNARFSIQEK